MKDEKAAILAAQDVFLYLSRHDLAPVALIEALAHANAPIVIDIGGLCEMVGPELVGNVLPRDLPREAVITRSADLVATYVSDAGSLARDRNWARARYVAAYHPDAFRARVLALIEESVPRSGSAPAGKGLLAGEVR